MAEAKDVAAKLVAAFNAHDEGALLALHAADIKFEAPGDFHAHTSAEATAYALRWLKAFPNGKMTVRSEITSGPWVIQEVLMEGIQSGRLEGPMGTIKPTGRKFTGRAVQILRIEGGHIAESRLYFDQVAMLSQLGVLPTPVAV
jgi:predicted ester cyclase